MLRVFRAVAETGSLAHAAEQLGRTSSALSMSLKSLEEHIGVALFETQRKSHLTPMGRHVLLEAQSEIAHFDETISRIEKLAKAKSGLIRLAVIPSFAQVFLPPVLHRFQRTHPDVLVELRDMDSSAVLNALSHDQADIAVATLPERPGFERKQLFSDAFGIVCPRGHRLQSDRNDLTWADLTGETLIANGLCAQIDDSELAPLLSQSRMMVHSTASLLALVRAGQGVTILPELVLSPNEQDLAFLPITGSNVTRQVHIMHRPEAALMPPVLAFLRCLQAEHLQTIQKN
nr:LysR family transcriptional regulator [Lentibacter algarum]